MGMQDDHIKRVVPLDKKNPKGAGRKPKSEEQRLVDSLSPYDKLAQDKLIEGVKEGNFHFIRLFYEYRYGKPKQQVDITTKGEELKQVFKIGNTEIEL